MTEKKTPTTEELSEVAIAAARPAIEREAKVVALREAADAVWPIDGRTRDAKTMVDWLRATADRIEQGGQS